MAIAVATCCSAPCDTIAFCPVHTRDKLVTIGVLDLSIYSYYYYSEMRKAPVERGRHRHTPRLDDALPAVVGSLSLMLRTSLPDCVVRNFVYDDQNEMTWDVLRMMYHVWR